MGALCLVEKRLSAKLVEPLGNLINTTPAMSLLYECINTVTLGMMDQLPLVKLSVQKLRAFIEADDQNRTYYRVPALSLTALPPFFFPDRCSQVPRPADAEPLCQRSPQDRV